MISKNKLNIPDEDNTEIKKTAAKITSDNTNKIIVSQGFGGITYNKIA